MAEVVNMPRLSDTMTEGVVAKWHKNVGDQVSEGDLLAEIETDKATMEFESFYSGTLLHVGLAEGDSAKVDSLLAIIGPKGTDVNPYLNGPKKVEEKPKPAEKKEDGAEGDEGEKGVKAPPPSAPPGPPPNFIPPSPPPGITPPPPPTPTNSVKPDSSATSPSDGNATTDSEAKKIADREAEIARVKAANASKRKEFQDKVAKANERAKELNENLAGWYYVISNEVYEKIRLDRKDFVKAKEKEEGEKPEEVKASHILIS